MDVAEKFPLAGWEKERPLVELAGAADVVQERGGEQDVGSEARMELRGLPAERGHRHRVLDESARVGVVRVGSRRQDA
jgi:hypothetical protein